MGPFEVSGFPGGDDPRPGKSPKYDAVVPHYDQPLKEEGPQGWKFDAQTLRQWDGSEQRRLRMSLGRGRTKVSREVNVRGSGEVTLRSIHRLPGHGVVFAEVEVEHDGAREPRLVGFQWQAEAAK